MAATPPGFIQVPDPSPLTTQQTLREIYMLREIIETRLDAMDKGILLLQEYADRSPSIAEVVAKMEERFISIQNQFGERDTRTAQIAPLLSSAVDAALTAAKELNAQQSASITEKIDKSEVSFSNQIRLLDDKIDALTIRTTGSEYRGIGKTDSWTWVAVLGFAALAILFVIFKGGV